MDKLKFIESYADSMEKSTEIAASSQKSSAARLVWFVAISGYAFLNVPVYLRAAIGEPVSGVALIAITIPWALAALLGIITHWLVGELVSLDNLYFVTLMASIRAFIMTSNGDPTDDQILDLLNEKDERVKSFRRKVDNLQPWVTRSERLIFFFLCFAFLWSVGYALWLIN
jgi:hypothetical protein